MKFRQNLTIFSFALAVLLLTSLSYLGHINNYLDDDPRLKKNLKFDEVDESFFKEVEYYSLDSLNPFIKLNATELSLSTTSGEVIGFNQYGVIRRFEKKIEKDPIIFKANNSRVFLKTKEVHLENNAEIKISSSNISATNISVLKEGEFVIAKKNVKTLNKVDSTHDQILVTSNLAFYTPKEKLFEFKENVDGQIKRKREYEENLRLKANYLSLDGKINKLELKGNVEMLKDNFVVQSSRGEVFLENYNKKLKYYALYDDVRLEEKLFISGKAVKRKAFAEKLEGIMADRRVVLTGFPKVFQDRDVIKGNRIIIRENIETVEVDDANTNITLDKEKE